MKLRVKKISKDKRGGIEGLPLQLIIMVAIAGIGMTVILGWMSNLETPKSIGAVYASPSEIVLTDEDGNGVYEGKRISLAITVLDQNGDPIPGATIVLEGASIATEDGRTPHIITDPSGKAVFKNLTLSQKGTKVAFVSATIAKNGYGTDTSLAIPVICE